MSGSKKKKENPKIVQGKLNVKLAHLKVLRKANQPHPPINPDWKVSREEIFGEQYPIIEDEWNKEVKNIVHLNKWPKDQVNVLKEWTGCYSHVPS